MQPISATEVEALKAMTVPPGERVNEYVFTSPAGLHSGPIPFTLTYLVIDENDDVHVIDPGWNSDENWSRLLANLEASGSTIDRVKSVTVTHFHYDHLDMAGRVRAASGAIVGMHGADIDGLEELRRADAGLVDHATARLDAWGVPTAWRKELSTPIHDDRALPAVAADIALVGGQLLDIPGRRLEVIHTPGHTPGHIAIRDLDGGLVFTGDHVLPTIYSGIGLGASTPDPIGDYFASLDRIAIDDVTACPGHEFRFTGLVERVDQIREHHLVRSREIATILASGKQLSVWDVASKVTWTLGWGNLHGLSLQSALNQTAMHIAYLT